ncbi:ribonuclease PH [Gimesia sp.]|uniref:ribonuclease PH n=1 Tax=Gimesia sp. TaxID=2024833 RepID=UPI003A91C512
MRHDSRQPEQLRPIKVERHYTRATPGSILISAGNTVVLCTASLDNSVPPWKKNDENPTGWVTAEYNMLPGSTSPRKQRRADGRSSEIQRLIGRSLRAVVDFGALGPRTITVDCDVLQADGGTRTLSITGGFLALLDTVLAIPETCELAPGEAFDPKRIFSDSVAAVSVGVVNGEPVLDLDYIEDSTAGVDMNVVMTGGGDFIEVQGTAEGQTFNRGMLDAQLELATAGIQQLSEIQKGCFGADWPL